MHKAKFTFFALFTILFLDAADAPKDQICHVWYNQEKDSRLEIYQKGNAFEAKIIWLKEPNEKDGRPKADKENPDEKLRSRPVIGLVILKDIHKSKEDPNFYESGRVYDPKNGKTYDCRMTFKGNTIDLRGYVMGIPFLGRTSVWTLAEPQFQK